MSDARQQHRTALRKTLIQVGILMAVVELAIMLTLEQLDVAISGWRLGLLDSAILTVIVGPLSYYGLVRPRDRRLRMTLQALDEAKKDAQRQARTDGLTGLLTRRALFEELAREWQRALRYDRELACVMVDLDDFKHINDTLGHQVGDEVIRRTAQVIGSHCRQADHVGRYGGEEFLLALPESDLDGAVALAERIRSTLAQTSFEALGGPERVTASVGVAQRTGHASLAETIRAADQALLQAKADGKNRVVANRPTLVA